MESGNMRRRPSGSSRKASPRSSLQERLVSELEAERRCIARVMSKTAPGDSRTLLSGMLDGIQYAIFTVRDVCSKEGGAWLR